MDLTKLNISELRSGYKKGDFTPADVVEAYLARIKEIDPKVSSYLYVDEKGALEAARHFEQSEKSNKDLPLWGIPFSAKDLYLTRGLPTTAASKILENFVAPYESTVTKRLKDAGAILLGKTNLDEFAMGSSTENSAYKTTRNPWDLDRVPGGSSGGSAASVSAGLAPFSLGTDTGGSIRQPASLCGVLGLKPTYGRVSRFGIIAMASSLDQAGPLSGNARDSAEVLNIMAGYDPQDATSSKKAVPDYTQFLDKDIKGLKIGLVKEFFAKGLDESVRQRIEEAIEQLKKAGAEFKEVSIPKASFGLSIYYILMMAEVSSNLARYDGIRYGMSEKDASLIEQYKKTRGKGLGAEAKRRIMLGSYVLSAGYFDAYYNLAQKARTALRAEFERAFGEVDILLGPVSPTPAFKVGEKMNDPVQMYLSDIYTVPINPAGLPAASVPCGLVEREGSQLPVSFQLIAPHFREDLIFQVAGVYEKLNPSSISKPNL